MKRLELPVDEFTTPNPITAREEVSIGDLAFLMKKNGIRHVPIVRNDRVVGIISERDLRVATALSAHSNSKITARDIMTHEPVTVSSDTRSMRWPFKCQNAKLAVLLSMMKTTNFWAFSPSPTL